MLENGGDERMTETFNPVDWLNRIPGEQWVMLDSVKAAEAYLSTFTSGQVAILRETWPNDNKLYARLSFPGVIPQWRVYVQAPPSSDS
jgi:hypothetical protein